jgi:hypothetical protein
MRAIEYCKRADVGMCVVYWAKDGHLLAVSSVPNMKISKRDSMFFPHIGEQDSLVFISG